MAIESLLNSFCSYLESLNDISNKHYKTDSKSTSVFMYFNEFKDFLADELGSQVNISSMTISDILNMDVKNGKLVEKNDKLKDSKDDNKDENKDANKDAADKNNVCISDILNDLFKDSSVKKIIDKDNNDKLNKKELTSFVDKIKSYDKDDKDISLDDIMSAVEEIQDGKFTLEDEEEEETSTESTEPETTTAAEGTGGAAPSGSTAAPSGGASSPSGGSSSPSNVNSVNTANTDTSNVDDGSLENKDLEELEQIKTDREKELDNAREDINDVYSGENDAVKDAQEDCDEKKKAYEDALKDDKNVSEDLKNKQKENQAKIDEQKGVIDGLKIDINNKEGEITNQNAIIESDNSQIAALEAAISELDAQSSGADDEAKADIESKKAEAQAQKEEIEQKRDNEDQPKLEELEQQKTELEEQLTTEEETLETLENEREEIENEILKTCDEETTKKAMEEFKEAEKNVDTVKETELEKAQEVVSEKQDSVDEINAAIDAKRAEDIQKEYSTNTDGKKLLSELTGDAKALFGNLATSLNLTEEEAADYIIKLCHEVGEDCIDPITFCAQLCQESGYKKDAVGDGGNAVGLGQLWPIAVAEVNRVYGTNYTEADRNDPYKNIEITMKLLKSCYQQTGTTEGMLGMYNQGTLDRAYNSGAQAYVAAVLGRLA